MTRRPLSHAPMSDAMLHAVAGRFRALSEPVRLRLMETLRARPRSVGELADAVGQSHANASKHLAVLAAAGFVVRSAEGNRAVYALADDATERLCRVVCDHVVSHTVGRLRLIHGRPAPTVSLRASRSPRDRRTRRGS